jgi:hypothetical protein
LWLIGAVCVKKMWSLWTIFFFTVLRRIVNLYACWWIAGNTRSATVWKIVPLCLLWCLWREMNDKSFEDRKWTLEEINSLFFNALYLWTAAFVSPLLISYYDFLVLFAPTRHVASLVYSMCTWSRPTLFMISRLLI